MTRWTPSGTCSGALISLGAFAALGVLGCAGPRVVEEGEAAVAEEPAAAAEEASEGGEVVERGFPGAVLRRPAVKQETTTPQLRLPTTTPVAKEEKTGIQIPKTVTASTAPSPWVARHGLTASQYQKLFDDLGRKGYRLEQVSGYTRAGSQRYAALWVKRSSVPWTARHGLSASAYQSTFTSLAGQGYRLVWVSGWQVAGQDRYAAIWEKRSGPAWVARHGLSASAYQQVFNQLTGQGYRLVHVDGWGVGSRDRYAAIWEKRSGPAWVARHNLSQSAYQRAFDDLGSKGYRLRTVSGYSVGGQDRYAAIWEKTSGPPWVSRHGIPGSRYQQVFDEQAYHGYRLVHVDAFASGSAEKFNAIWHDAATKETRRLEALMNRLRDDAAFGSKVVRGFLVKKAEGPVLAEIASTRPFQPASTLKLLPYLYAIEEIDRGRASLGSTVKWIGNPGNVDADCLSSGTPGSATFGDALPTLMWFSHNRTLNAFFDVYHPVSALTPRAQNGWKMSATKMFLGCNGDWLKNRSTLHDIARLYEGADGGGILRKSSSRTLFFNALINLMAGDCKKHAVGSGSCTCPSYFPSCGGNFYRSPYTGKSAGPYGVGAIQNLVASEGGSGFPVSAFMDEVVVRGKGGGATMKGDALASDSLYVTLPFKNAKGEIVPGSYVVAWYVNGWDPACESCIAADVADFEKFKSELLRAPVEQAVASW